MTAYRLIATYRRTIGSVDQRLVKVGTPGPRPLYQGALFFDLERNGVRYFGKKVADPYAETIEMDALNSVDHPHVLSLVDFHHEYGMISRRFDGETLSRIDLRQIKNARTWHQEFLEVVELLQAKRLYGVIDIHQSNILAEVENHRISDWLLIDFGPHRDAARRTRRFLGTLNKTISRHAHAR